jgi:hypothetical protein
MGLSLCRSTEYPEQGEGEERPPLSVRVYRASDTLLGLTLREACALVAQGVVRHDGRVVGSIHASDTRWNAEPPRDCLVVNIFNGRVHAIAGFDWSDALQLAQMQR